MSMDNKAAPPRVTCAGFDVAVTPLVNTNEALWYGYDGFCDGKSVSLSAGHKQYEGARALPEALTWIRDLRVPVRDGVRLTADVFLPADRENEKLPAIIMYSPFGKPPRGRSLIRGMPIFYRVGVPLDRTSGYEQFEGLDPAEWCPKGYAIVHPDARGVWDSEGVFRWNGVQEGEDVHDVIEWTSQQEWCNGKVAMAGNSWLVQSMWQGAALNPPHLTCIAPWEGFADYYRDTLCRGGIPSANIWEHALTLWEGRGWAEDPFTMLKDYPLMNAYWESKRAPLHKINVPAYIKASYSTGLHTYGTCRAWRELSTEDKWFRFDATQEWHDLYNPKYVEDLSRFFAHFLQGVPNGWEKDTPRVRLSLLGMNQPNLVDLPEKEWPLARTEYRRFYLAGNASLVPNLPPDSVSVDTFDGTSVDNDKGRLLYHYKFEENTNLAGYPVAVLYMASDEAEDWDLWVQIRKMNVQGELVEQFNIPIKDLEMCGAPPGEPGVPLSNIYRHRGPMGRLRASRAEIDETKGTHFDPFYPFTSERKVPRGQVVKLTVGIWPMGLYYKAGESLVFTVSGFDPAYPEFPDLPPTRGDNVGQIKVHMGGDFPSYVQVPVI